MEIHPLFNLHFNVINNIHDPSAILHPWAVYSVTQHSTLLFGANVYYGDNGSEYGGFLIPGTALNTNASANVYLLFSYYF